MKTRKLILTALFLWFATEWAAIVKRWAITGQKPPAAAWVKLELMAATLLWWFSFDATARLNYRATGQQLVLPNTPAGKSPGIDATIRANPRVTDLLKTARAQSFNLAREWRKSEQKQAERLVIDFRGAAPAKPATPRFPPFDQTLFKKSIDYRVRRFRRDRASRAVVAAEEQLLADPEIGSFFPFAEYHTREDWRVRPTHAAMLGFVARRTDPVWQWIIPANGHNCRCYRILRTARESIARGWMSKSGKPLFAINWPNETARANYRRGIPFHGNGDARAVPKSLRKKVFPDPGPWMLSRESAITV